MLYILILVESVYTSNLNNDMHIVTISPGWSEFNLKFVNQTIFALRRRNICDFILHD